MDNNPFELYESHPQCAEGNAALQAAVDAAWEEAKSELGEYDDRAAVKILSRVFQKLVCVNGGEP